jgi:beta-glucosidase
MNPQNNELNRRKFLSTMTTAAGLLALGMNSSASISIALPGEPEETETRRQGKRIGISERAYQKAWKRAEALVSKMTLDEKISQLGSQALAIDRLNVPGYNYYTGEALHGLLRGAPVTAFPVPLALAASWNPELFLKVYSVVSDEARAYDNRDKNGLSYYSPITLNLHRDPRWGRCDEAPGEDPCLAATVGVQVIRGMQGENPDYLKTTACSKHFVCNNTDDDRTWISADVDARSFWEYYTRAECAMVREGDVFTVMGAYNALNGVPCCANDFLLTELLRRRWGFRGYVTSDCDAIDNIYDPHHYAANLPIAAAMAVSAGCDLNCGGTLQANLRAAVDQELIGEEEIGLSVIRLMTVRYLLGLFDPPASVSYTQISFDIVDSETHRALALEAARQSLVLLKNDSQFLPLDKAAVKKIAVIGPLAGLCQLGGYSGAPIVRVSPYEGIANHLGVEIFHPNVSAAKKVATSNNIRLEASSEGESNIGFIENNSWAEFPKMNFDGKTEFEARVSSYSNGGRIEVHLDKLDGPLACTLTAPHTGAWQNWVNVVAPLQNISGEHSIFMRFVGGDGWLLNVERFQLNPVIRPTPQPGQPQVIFAQGCSATDKKDDKMFQEALDATRGADVVVLVCGVTEDVDREGVDRKTLELSGAQHELIQAVYGVNPNIVLVLSSNNTVAVEWEQKHLPAILCAICAGQSQGTAIAEVLFGDYNPGGKLPCTWYRSVDQLPPAHDYDIHKGRTYMYFDGDPLYSFGHGLSYTTFSMDQFQMDTSTLRPGEKVSISATVTNTGNRAGAEIVQLYITAPPSPVKRPNKQLAGFQRIELKPGEQKTVNFELPFTEPAFWYWDEAKRGFICQPGTAKILVGDSSANILLTGELTLPAANMVLPGPEMLEGVAVKSGVA